MNPADVVTAPRYQEVAVKATSGTAGTQNLDLVGLQTASNSTQLNVGGRNRYVRLKAMTADCSVVFASTSALASNVQHLTAGVNQTSGGYPLTAGIAEDFVVPSDNFWLGFITGGGSGSLVVYINSRPLG